VAFGAVAFAFDDARLSMMEQPVEQCGGERRVSSLKISGQCL
jgi:hypothetical protein